VLLLQLHQLHACSMTTTIRSGPSHRFFAVIG
jgi:hypothetical protein